MNAAAPDAPTRWLARPGTWLSVLGLIALVGIAWLAGSAFTVVDPSIAQGLSRADEALVATFPPHWEAGDSWTVEYESTTQETFPRLREDRTGGPRDTYYGPIRRYVTFSVLEVSKTLALVDILDEDDPTRRERIAIGRESLRVERRVPRTATPTSLEDPRWGEFQDDAEIFGCAERTYPNGAWMAPNLKLARVGRDEVVSARRGLRPLGTGTQDVELLPSGLVEIRVRSQEDLERGTTSVYQWRAHEPWWAKMECEVPPSAPPPPHAPQRRGFRFVRARLVAVRDAAVEVLPWTFPPARHFAEPDLPGSDGFGYAGDGYEDDPPYTRLLRVRANNPRP